MMDPVVDASRMVADIEFELRRAGTRAVDDYGRNRRSSAAAIATITAVTARRVIASRKNEAENDYNN